MEVETLLASIGGFSVLFLKIPDVYACISCSRILKSNLSKDGTGKLSRHFKSCDRSSYGFDSYFDRECMPSAAKKIKAEHKKAVNDAAVSFVVNDMRPIDAVTKKGLIQLLAVFTWMGAHYGKMNEDEVLNMLPSRFSVSFST